MPQVAAGNDATLADGRASLKLNFEIERINVWILSVPDRNWDQTLEVHWVLKQLRWLARR